MAAVGTGMAIGYRRRQRSRRHRRIVVILFVSVLALMAWSLMKGQSFTPLPDVVKVLLGQDVPGSGFAVGQLRLPRAVLALLVGLSFGLGGVVFQIMLRNPLASPDIIGVSSGASAAAVFAIVILSMNGTAVAICAIVMGLLSAMLVYGLSWRNGVTGTRLILVGIGIAAMNESFIAWTLSQAAAWDLQQSMRWLTGSLNGARLDDCLPVLFALILCGGALLAQGRNLDALRLGDDMAASLGVNIARTRLIALVFAVGMISVATSVTGPIAFVAFLSGPIASRLVGLAGSLLVPSALVGALLVLLGDHVGQFLLPSRYPVGVVTGALGAPYLVYLIVRVNRRGGSL